MAITINYRTIIEKYNSKYWKNFEEFEKFYLQEITETSSHTIFILIEKEEGRKYIR